MAQCKLTPREFILNVYSPQIAAVCSSNAEATCQRNNLSFIQLLQPFCRINAEGYIKDPQGTNIVVRSLQICVKDVNSTPPETTQADRLLHESVSSSYCDNMITLDIGKCKIEIPVSVPWYEAWRETFLNVQFPSDHEFTKHFLACMIVVSTSDDDPKEKIQQMSTHLNQNSSEKRTKWFNNNTLRYYVLVHDVTQDDKRKAGEIFTDLKNLYGSNNCFLLQMNSRPPGHLEENTYLPDPWSQFITKHLDVKSSTEQSSSPRTPADTSCVSAMPNQVVTEPDKSSNAGTPVTSHNPILGSPDSVDRVCITSSRKNSVHRVSSQLEIGQEAVPVTIHPLSPEEQICSSINNIDSFKPSIMDNKISLINENVWADSPNYVTTQHGARLSLEDLERLRAMMTHFSLKSLLPYVEKQIALLNDVILNKKSVGRGLLNVTKRWFGPSKAGVPGSTPSNAVIYTIDSAEMQLRRLGDLCFMFGHYTLAYQAYHNAKRDFDADQAWIYYAGALEMAALSAFMMNEVTRKTIDYMDEAITTYMNVCKLPQFATRATVLSAECLKNSGMYGEAAKQLIRMIREDSHLSSALLLEQAAYCFIEPKMVRKYAFNAVFAGYRFSKAGQKRHSLRCYQQAHQVYKNKGWSFAEDHIYFKIGRQAFILKQTARAVEAFENLLSETSKQPAVQQSDFLYEFLNMHKQLSEEMKSEDAELPDLPLPLINGNQIKALFDPSNKFISDQSIFDRGFSLTDNPDVYNRWSKLEKILITKVQGSVPMVFKPTVTLYSDFSNNSVLPKVIIDELIYYSVELQNPLEIPLALSNLTLICSHEDNESMEINTMKERQLITDKMNSKVICSVTESMILQRKSKQNVLLSLTPKQVGKITVLGIKFGLSASVNNSEIIKTDVELVSKPTIVRGKILFNLKMKKMKNVKEKQGVEMYEKDYRLQMEVFEKAPYLKVTFSKLTPEMLCGEIQKVDVELENAGNAPLTNIYIATTNPQLFSLENSDIDNNEEKTSNDGLVMKLDLPDSMNGVLQVGEVFKTTFWVRAPLQKGNHRLDFIFYYENFDAKSVPHYRIARHTCYMIVVDSINISAITRRSARFNDDGPTLNLTIQIINTNQVHNSSFNEVQLTNISLLGPTWSLHSSNITSSESNIKPQEIIHFLLKLRRRSAESTSSSDLKLTAEEDMMTPYMIFVRRRNAQRLEQDEVQSLHKYETKKLVDEKIAVTLNLNATLVLRWKIKVVKDGNVSRFAVGQHHIDLEALNMPYTHLNEIKNDQVKDTEPLKIFGPDANVNERKMVLAKETYSEEECLKSVISYCLRHSININHDFGKTKICIIPVQMELHNNSTCLVIVKVDTLGFNSPENSQLLKSKNYSHASNCFRYIGNTGIKFKIQPFCSHTVKLQALVSMTGTYDLASRLIVSINLEKKTDFIPQDWRIESVCFVNDVKTSK